MSRIAYVNGRYVSHRRAYVHIEDRGYQFSDGVYEVIAVRHGRLIDGQPHLDRLARSLLELRIRAPMPTSALLVVIDEVIRRNGLDEGTIYLQITRGVAPRDHAFPKNAVSSLVLTARHVPLPRRNAEIKGVRVVGTPDLRWGRRDIKSISLLPNVLGKQQAKELGAFEAWQIDPDGTVTEGTSSNAWIVNDKSQIITRQANSSILNGVTRVEMLTVIAENGLSLVERPFTIAEARRAREAFLTSSTNFILPVIMIDDMPVADGVPGPITRKLYNFFLEHIELFSLR